MTRFTAGLSVLILLLAAATAFAGQEKPAEDFYIIRGNPIGAVKFDHKMHSVNFKCETCHHASKPQKPQTSRHQACLDCHTNPATPPLTTTTRAAFHNSSASGGTCMDCHKKERASGKKVPITCTNCHKREND